MELNLKKPIIFLDIEATGLSIINDRIIEIGLLKVEPGQEKPEKKLFRVNPQKEISDSAYKVHGISSEDLQEEPSFNKIAKEVVGFIGNADLAGFNLLKFDLPLLMEELIRADVSFSVEQRKIIDVQKIFHMMEKRTLEAAYAFYCGKDLKESHSAMGDTEATYEVFLAQLQHYEELTNDIDEVYNYTGKPGGQLVDPAGRMVYDKDRNEVFNFGKYKGRKVAEVLQKDPAYYSWMMNKEFPEFTKKKLTEVRLRLKN